MLLFYKQNRYVFSLTATFEIEYTHFWLGSSRLFPTGWIIVKPLVSVTIGDSCATLRWQDHHDDSWWSFFHYISGDN